MSNNINELMVKNFSSLVKEFIESVEGDVKSPMDAHVILTARDDAVVLVIVSEAKLYDAALNTMPIIMLEKKEDGLFRPVFDFLGNDSAIKGLALWASFLEHALEVEDILKKDKVVPVKESKVFFSPKGVEYNEDDINRYLDECNKMREAKCFKAEYLIDDYLEGKKADDYINPKPIIVDNRRDLARALHKFKAEQGLSTIKDVAKVLGLSASQVWCYFYEKSYPTHTDVKDILERRLNISIRKEVK